MYAAGMVPQQPNLASNPFFNMGTVPGAAAAGFPAMTQVCLHKHLNYCVHTNVALHQTTHGTLK